MVDSHAVLTLSIVLGFVSTTPLPAHGQTCSPLTEATAYATVRLTSAPLFGADGVQYGQLGRGDLVRVIGTEGANTLVRAPISDATHPSRIATKSLCAIQDSVVLSRFLYPLPGARLDGQMLGILALDNVESSRVAQTAILKTTAVDRAGNSYETTFRAAKWYAGLGRTNVSATGWYDVVKVRIAVFDAYSFQPTDLGEDLMVSLRQGYDSASRSILLFEDPGNTGTPFVVVAGTNSDTRSVSAWVLGAGEQWLTFRCNRNQASLVAKSRTSYQGVRAILVKIASDICAASP